MRTTLACMQYLVAAGFLFVGLQAFRHYRQQRIDHLFHLSLAASLVGVTALLGRLIEQTDYRYVILGDLALATTVGSAYFLLEFRNDFIPLGRVWLNIARIAAVAVVAAGVIAPIPFEAHASYSNGDVAVLSLIGLVWVFFVGEPVLRFVRAARDRPPVQAARLRALSTGYAVLIVLVALSVFERPNDEVTLGVVVNSFALALIPILYVSFDPPGWVRRVWRGQDERALKMASSLTTFAESPEVLADRALEAAIAFAGADAGFLIGPRGKVLASRHATPEEIDHVRARLVDEPDRTLDLHEDSTRYGIGIPLEMTEGRGLLGLLMGPFTPLFGSDEITRLHEYGVVVSSAFDRVELVEDLHQERVRNESLLGAVSDLGEGFVVTDGRKFLFVNDAYCRLSGYTEEEVLAFDSVWALTPAEDIEMLTERVRSRLAGGSVQDHYEAAMIHKDGHKVDVEVSVKLVTAAEGGPQIMSIVRDISERKRLERFREQFITDAAHELRTPVTTLVGMSSLLAKRDRLTEAQVDDAVLALNRQGERLQRLVNNLLDLAELRQGRATVELVPVVFNDIVNDVLTTLPPPEGKKIYRSVEPDLTVIADPGRLDQIITNLVSNAYRYGGDRIEIAAHNHRRGVTVVVADNGAGVPEALIPELFETFTRGENSATIQGSGLGLAIVRMLAESCDGRIDYEPGEPAGARFVLSLKGPESLT